MPVFLGNLPRSLTPDVAAVIRLYPTLFSSDCRLIYTRHAVVFIIHRGRMTLITFIRSICLLAGYAPRLYHYHSRPIVKRSISERGWRWYYSGSGASLTRITGTSYKCRMKVGLMLFFTWEVHFFRGIDDDSIVESSWIMMFIRSRDVRDFTWRPNIRTFP